MQHETVMAYHRLSVRVADIAWLAGLLEGEGCFASAASKSPIIQVLMTDRDVVQRAGRLLGATTAVRPATTRRPPRKAAWRTGIYGNRAAGWMMTLYPFLGTRRRAKIRQVLTLWRTYVAHQRDREFCKNGHALAGANVLAAQWTDSAGTVHKKARRCRTCFNLYVKRWRAAKPDYQVLEGRERRRRQAERDGRVYTPRSTRRS